MHVSKIAATLNNIFDHLNVKHDLYAVGPLSEAVTYHFSKIQKVSSIIIIKPMYFYFILSLDSDFKYRVESPKCYTY